MLREWIGWGFSTSMYSHGFRGSPSYRRGQTRTTKNPFAGGAEQMPTRPMVTYGATQGRTLVVTCPRLGVAHTRKKLDRNKIELG